VFRPNKPRIASFRAEYAKQVDFCDVFKSDTKPLYLLAFFLTANHKESEQCFVSTVEDAFKERAVFKEWARPWVRRKLIENAIEIVLPRSARNDQKRDLWSAGQRGTQRGCEIDRVTKLATFERFVFVITILERCSNLNCSLLLGCSMDKIVQARLRALRQLTGHSSLFSQGDDARLQVQRGYEPAEQ
jgi:hypothetical protein